MGLRQERIIEVVRKRGVYAKLLYCCPGLPPRGGRHFPALLGPRVRHHHIRALVTVVNLFEINSPNVARSTDPPITALVISPLLRAGLSMNRVIGRDKLLP